MLIKTMPITAEVAHHSAVLNLILWYFIAITSVFMLLVHSITR